jgi:predicted metal-binding protein
MTRPEDPRVTVTLCRGCCCGSLRKHPSTDHEGQRSRLEEAASDRVRVQVVDCIDRCERSNVVLVRERLGPGQRRDTWFGNLHYRAHTTALVEWIALGCPDDVPTELGRLRIPPP